jgi:hypothetical protein
MKSSDLIILKSKLVILHTIKQSILTLIKSGRILIGPTQAQIIVYSYVQNGQYSMVKQCQLTVNNNM